MSTVQIRVHWREPVDNESSSLFKGCVNLKNDDTLLQFKQGAVSRCVTLVATQLITITPEKEPA